MSLKYMLDTDICIYITKHAHLSIRNKLGSLTIGEVGMSTITYGELWYGAQKSKNQKKTQSLLNELTSFIIPLPLSTLVGHHYGEIRAQLSMAGQPIGNNDLWIAAHALSLEVILVTNNTKEFSRVPNLKLENWVS